MTSAYYQELPWPSKRRLRDSLPTVALARRRGYSAPFDTDVSTLPPFFIPCANRSAGGPEVQGALSTRCFCRCDGALSRNLLRMHCRLLDCCRNLLWMGDINRMARAGYLNRVAFCPIGIPPLQFGIDGSVRPRYQHPTRPGSPRGSSDNGFEVVSEICTR